MGRNLTPFEQALYRRTDEVLHYIWDPIGVAGCPQARDEYEAYLPHVFQMLLGRKPAEEIAAYLTEVEESRMGLNTSESTKANAGQAASFVADWYETLRANYDAHP